MDGKVQISISLSTEELALIHELKNSTGIETHSAAIAKALRIAVFLDKQVSEGYRIGLLDSNGKVVDQVILG